MEWIVNNTPADAPLKPRIPNPRQRPASNCFPFPQSACQFCPSWYISTVVISSLHIVVDIRVFLSIRRSSYTALARTEGTQMRRATPARATRDMSLSDDQLSKASHDPHECSECSGHWHTQRVSRNDLLSIWDASPIQYH